MDYEKLYKEALERAEIWQQHLYESDDKDYADELNYIFPELTQSDDEKIRKAIIKMIEEDSSVYEQTITPQEMIAWLKKQGEEKYSVWVGGTEINDYYITKKEAEKLAKKYKEEGYDDVVIEKQGEKKSNPCLDCTNSKGCINCESGELRETIKKPADKIEPQFKVGDWVVHDMLDGRKVIRQIVNMTNKSYILDGEDFNTFYFSDLEKDYHLWTIQDAKDGDVLSDEKPFIFRGFGDKEHPNNPTAYCGIGSSGTFILSTEKDWWTDKDFHPATKKQRDLLFQKMKEAGYEWDAEKKELKITDWSKHIKANPNGPSTEQKPTWNEEDEEQLDRAIYMMGQLGLTKSWDDVYNWLKLLKNRI